MSSHDSTKKFITGLLFGSLAGAVAAMLYTPQSGDDTRRMIRNTAMDATVKTRDGLRTAQEQIQSRVGDVQMRANDIIGTVSEDVRQRASRLTEIGQEVLQREKDLKERETRMAKDMLEEQKDILQSGANQAQDALQ